MSQLFAGEFDRFRVLVERQNIRPGLQEQLGMAAPAACPVQDQSTGPWRQQFHGFRRQHRAMIAKIFHLLRLLQDQWTGREPDRPIEQ